LEQVLRDAPLLFDVRPRSEGRAALQAPNPPRGYPAIRVRHEQPRDRDERSAFAQRDEAGVQPNRVLLKRPSVSRSYCGPRRLKLACRTSWSCQL
jgi:hypothetical protein